MADVQERLIEAFSGMRIKGYATSVITNPGEARNETDHDLAKEIVGAHIQQTRAECSRRNLGSCAIQPEDSHIGGRDSRTRRVDTYRAICDKDCPMGLPVGPVGLLETTVEVTQASPQAL